MQHDGGLDQPHLTEGAVARNRIYRGVRHHSVSAKLDPGRGLSLTWRNEEATEQGCHAEGLGPCHPPRHHSESATAPRPAERLARTKSRFIRVIVSMLMSLGHASWHSPYRVQPPKCSRSIRATIARALRYRSGCPCGRSPRCVSLAAVKREADALGQAATQAPHP